MDPKAEIPASTPSHIAAGAARASRWTLPKLPVLIGVIGLGAVVTTGTWFKRRADTGTQAAIARIQAELAQRRSEAEEYRGRFEHLRWTAEHFPQSDNLSGSPDSAAGWARERARLFAAMLNQIDRSAEEARFTAAANAIDAACARGDLATARQQLTAAPRIQFPDSAEFRRLQQENYFKPLARLSRQNPDYYRAFQREEPEAFAVDFAGLRSELDTAEAVAVTPQLMLRIELLTAVAPPGDPLVADWSVLTTAADYFENPDPATLASWRQAQRALRLSQWQTAVAHMQSILRTTVRTRQPYRAAYGWALIKNRPDAAAEAYPFLSEAAGAGDAAARAWVIQDDWTNGRYDSARRWLEGAVAAGDLSGAAKLVQIYEMKSGVTRDPAREAGMLQRIIVTPDAPALASRLLARLYESGGGVAESPAKASAFYERAAQGGDVLACAEIARRYRDGTGVPQNLDRAREWALRAYAAGDIEGALPLLIELMETSPERTAPAVQEMFERIQVAAPAGFADTRLSGPGVAKLQIQVARYFDRAGDFARAARLYGEAGATDRAAGERHAELVTAHPCETCGGVGKIKTFTACPTCGGKGTVICHVCDGRGYKLVPGTPPCTTCGGSGTMVQNGRSFACSACGGTGKGKGSVIKEECTACVHGREICRDCTGGQIVSMKECPDCHGTGARALADQ